MTIETRQISVSATAILRVEPDLAVVSLAVVQADKDPKIAYSKAQNAIAKVRQFVADFERVELRSSTVHLGQAMNQGTDTKFSARINLTLLIKELTSIEQLIVGVIEAGANQLVSTEYSTSLLKETRDRSRLMALSAAQKKADAIARGASVGLGQILSIRENHFDPSRQTGGHVPYVPIDIEDQVGAISPGSIAVGATIIIAYELEDPTDA